MTAYGERRILALPSISPSLSQGIGQGGEIGQLRGGRDGVPSFLFLGGLWLVQWDCNWKTLLTFVLNLGLLCPRIPLTPAFKPIQPFGFIIYLLSVED